jgi:hypothetical protein
MKQLLMVVNDVQLRTLLDFGSTHNFIDSAAADRATVSFQECAGLRIAVANDDRLTSPSRCQGLHLNVVGEVFRIDCYGLALESFDTVLGVQWLESLGPILWDFSHRTMAFVRNGRHICWTAEEAGDGPAKLFTVEADLMEELLGQFSAVFAPLQGLPPTRQRCHHI